MRPHRIEPGPGQESVWDYPRPPVVQPANRLVIVRFGDTELARTTAALRLLETASPPGYYLPPEDVTWEHLVEIPGTSFCEWKGAARYWGLTANPQGTAVGWSYPSPNPTYHDLRGYLSFYPGRVECYVDDERVRPQPGRFYGGWITDEIAGPVKGEPGTGHW